MVPCPWDDKSKFLGLGGFALDKGRLFSIAAVTLPSAGVGDGKYKDLFGKYFEDHRVGESPEKAPSESPRRLRLQETESKRIDFNGRERGGGVFGEEQLAQSDRLVVVPAGRFGRLRFGGRQDAQFHGLRLCAKT